MLSVLLAGSSDGVMMMDGMMMDGWHAESPDSDPCQERQLTPADFAAPGDLPDPRVSHHSVLGNSSRPRD